MERIIGLESFEPDQACFCEEPDKTAYVIFNHQGGEVRFCPRCGGERREIDFGETDIGPEEDDDEGELPNIDVQLQISEDNEKVDSHEKTTILTTGSHIAWVRGRGKRLGFIPGNHSHHAVVERNDGEYLHIIHYAIDERHNKALRIHRKQLHLASHDEMGYDDLYVINYPRKILQENPPSLVLERAVARLGEEHYNPLLNNCESFVTFCKTGFSQSLQVSARLQSCVKKFGSTLSSFSKKPKAVIWTNQLLTEDLIKSSLRSDEDSRPRVIDESLHVVTKGMIIISDMNRLYDERIDEDLNRKYFEEKIVSRLLITLSMFLLVAGAIIAAGGAAGLATGVYWGALVGSVVPGVGSVVGGVIVGTTGLAVSAIVVKRYLPSRRCAFLDRQTINSIETLKVGDHIALFNGYIFHRRCHGIVTDIKVNQCRFSLVRNLPVRGVVEEEMNFKDVIRINYAYGECCHPRKVVKRAHERLGQVYSTFNCKQFAELLKRKELPEALSVDPNMMVSPGPDELPSLDFNTGLKDSHNLLQTETAITQLGGMLQIPNTGVTLMVPPNALPKDMEKCIVKMKIVPRKMDEGKEPSFSSNSSVIVELLPDNLRLQRHARLRLPHCLVLHQTMERKIRIFVSHHEKENHPQWEEQTHLPYYLNDTSCVILLDSFCWVKFSVNDNIVEAKKIVLYAASDKPPQDNATIIEVGYCADLPCNTEFLQTKPRLGLVHKRIFFFRKKKYPLKLSLDQMFSEAWKCCPEDKNVKEIPFETIASSTPHSFFYILQRRGSSKGNFLCIFTASQEKGQIPVQLVCYPQTKKYNRPPTRGMDTFSESLLQTEKYITQKGGTLKIPETGVELEVLPDALPDNIEQCQMYMTITPSRNMQDEVVSFSSNSSVAVEIFADGIKLKSPVKLTLPHCLKLHKNAERKVKIFTKNFGEDWKEEKNVQFQLEDAACIMWTDRLCCIKYHVDNEIVIGKKIVVYTATRNDIEKNELANVEVGYYPDIPGGGELLRMNRNIVVDCKRNIPYLEIEGSPLELLLYRIVPQQWRCPFPEGNLQKIPFRMIAGSIEHSCSYILQQTDEKAGNPVCKFTAVQKGVNIPVELVVTAYPQGSQLKLHQEGQASADPMTSTFQGSQLKLHQEGQASADPMTSTFQYLSKNLIGNEWKSVGRRLGLQDADVDHIKQDYKITEERIYEMLIKWKHKNGTEATHTKLIQSLEQAGRKDLAEDLQNRKDQEGL